MGRPPMGQPPMGQHPMGPGPGAPGAFGHDGFPAQGGPDGFGPAYPGPAYPGSAYPGPAYAGPDSFGPDSLGPAGAEAGPPDAAPEPLWKTLAAIGVAAVVGVGVAFVIYGFQGDKAGGTGATASASPSAPKSSGMHGQAAAIDKVLDGSKPSRGKLQQGLSQMLHCTKTGQAIAAIQQATNQRAAQVQQAKKLKVGLIEGGDELKQHLVNALVASQQADAAYLKWAKKYQANNCTGPTAGDAYYDAGNAASERATKAKSAFVELWGPIAEQEGLPARTRGSI
ncbi:hypothetical protein [Planotetraspora kaengkrachanensis]|nr:hypothetical protein [Planotetraspora kaengkrachanensis]